MANNPYKPFNDAATNKKQEPSKLKGLLDLNPERDKGNTEYRIPKPKFAPSNEPRYTPRGVQAVTSKHYAPRPQEPSDTLKSIAHEYGPNLLTDGSFGGNKSQQYLLDIDTIKSPSGLDSGKILALEIQQGGKIVAQFRDGTWTRSPDNQEQKELVQKLQDTFGDLNREPKPIDHSKNRSNDRDR